MKLKGLCTGLAFLCTTGMAQSLLAADPGVPVGDEQVVNLIKPHVGNADMAQNASGHFAVAWIGDAPDTAYSRVYVRPYAPDGTALSEPVIVAEAPYDHTHINPGIEVRTDGSIVVTWLAEDVGASEKQILARLFNRDGTPIGPAFTVTGHFPESYSTQVDSDAQGNFVVSWAGHNAALTQDSVNVRRFDADGNALTADLEVETDPDARFLTPRVAMAPDGSYAVVWEHYHITTDAMDPNEFAIRAKRFDANDNLIGARVDVNQTAIDGQQWFDIASHTDGGFVVAWDSDAYDILVRQFDSNANATSNEIQVNTTLPYGDVPRVATDAFGRTAVAWTTGGDHDGSGKGAYFSLFDADGTTLVDEQRINDGTDLDEKLPQIGLDADGDIVAAFARQAPDYSQANHLVRRFHGPTEMDLALSPGNGDSELQNSGNTTLAVIIENPHSVQSPSGVDVIDREVGAASGISVHFDLAGPGLDYQSASSDDWHCEAADNAVTCRKATSLQAGGNTELALEFLATDMDARTVTVTATSAGNEMNTADNSTSLSLAAGESESPGSSGSSGGSGGSGGGPLSLLTVLGLLMISFRRVRAG